jgi:hypothetical protein|tara:strand:- start:5812 stop:5937 length:126 start_codon:yes stop_codon:yes gene_type:complete
MSEVLVTGGYGLVGSIIEEDYEKLNIYRNIRSRFHIKWEKR